MDNFFKNMSLDQKIAHFDTAMERLAKKQLEANNEANKINAELKACWGVGPDEQITIPAIVKLINEVANASKTNTIIRP